MSSTTTVLLLASALGVLAVDQATKGLVEARLAVGRLYGGTGGLGLRRLANPRLGRLPLSDTRALVAWALVPACLTLLLAVVSPPSSATAVGLGLSWGGAAGNLLDRLVRGAVLDFIVVGRWPTFNLADAAMVAGVVLVAVSLL